MTTFYWSERFCIGDETIDAQHCYLFALANELLTTTGKVALTQCAMKLFRYVREHFNHEEALMRRIGYPDEQDHVHLHDELITRLATISQAIQQDEWSSQEMELFMVRWLLGHILQVDIRLAEYMKRPACA
jgi:hemerythrin